MRVVNWNCNGALRKKFHLLNVFSADVLVIQECENPEVTKDLAYLEWAGQYLWTGENRHKGLAVFVKNGLKLEALNIDAGRLQMFLPCRINDVSLLAIWTKEADSPTFKYIGQLYKWLQLHRHHLIGGETMVIGDLNSNAIWDVWDRWWNHSDVVNDLEGIGIRSLYHTQTGQAQGEETTPTFFLHRNTLKHYHIDYAFLSEDLRSGAHLEVGTPDLWLEHSDHMPMIIDLPTTTKM